MIGFGSFEPPEKPSEAELRPAISAVLYGSVWNGFDGPTGVTKDEALLYAATLALWVQSRLDLK